jgi:uncharacterized SAM-binding protein YcdF (DUF218 family)
VRLYREGYANTLVLSPGQIEPAEARLRRQGVRFPSDVDIERDVIVQLGVPSASIVPLPDDVDNTAQEADKIAPLVNQRGWTRLIVITDRSSTRRAGYAFRRVFGDRVGIVVTCNRVDPYDVRWWWRHRWSIRETMYEFPKLMAYWAGLKG